jgi:hypothetical protein
MAQHDRAGYLAKVFHKTGVAPWASCKHWIGSLVGSSCTDLSAEVNFGVPDPSHNPSNVSFIVGMTSTTFNKPQL